MPNAPLEDPFNPNNPATQIALLAQRLDNLGREKEALEEHAREQDARIQKLEAVFNNMEFMGRWTWRAIAGAIFLTGSFYSAFKIFKGGS